jgi:hypothetical protein
MQKGSRVQEGPQGHQGQDAEEVDGLAILRDLITALKDGEVKLQRELVAFIEPSHPYWRWSKVEQEFFLRALGAARAHKVEEIPT